MASVLYNLACTLHFVNYKKVMGKSVFRLSTALSNFSFLIIQIDQIDTVRYFQQIVGNVNYFLIV